jgi:hypothetical protein
MKDTALNEQARNISAILPEKSLAKTASNQEKDRFRISRVVGNLVSPVYLVLALIKRNHVGLR